MSTRLDATGFRPSSSRNHAVRGLAALLAVVLLAALGIIVNNLLHPSGGEAVPLYVSPDGSDDNDGSATDPLRTLQAALQLAIPGTVINLAPGIYRESVTTVRDGAPNLPITIKGPETGTDHAGRYQAILFSTGRAISIDHSYYSLDGFTIDGQEALSTTPFPTELSAMDGFKNMVRATAVNSRLVYVAAADEARDLTGITIRNMFLSGSGGECVRLRNNAHDNVITDSVIQYCGLLGNTRSGAGEYHNGEGVYIGTSPKSDDQPMSDSDTSSRNLVSHNIIRTFGTECLDVKENAHDNVFENNQCSDNTESTYLGGSNIELRGHANTVSGNEISGSAGYNIKIQTDGEEYDKGGNSILGNRLAAAAGPAFSVKSTAAPGPVCGNTVAPPTSVGNISSGDPLAPCPNGVLRP